MTTKTTEPQLTESDVNDFESSLLLAVDGKAMVRVNFAAALIRDWRAMRAASEWQKSTIENLTVGITGCAERLVAARPQAYEEGFEAGTAFAKSVIKELQSENAALREQLAELQRIAPSPSVREAAETPEHKEQARAMIALWINKLDKVDSRLPPLLIDAVTAALSSRDTEIRKVLASLQRRENCWCEWKEGHAGYCQLATSLYAKLQPGK